MKHLDELLDILGGFGRFQFVTLFGMYSSYFVTGWSMMQMAFAGMIPDWICITDTFLDPGKVSLVENNVTTVSYYSASANSSAVSRFGSNVTKNVCFVNGTKCEAYSFLGSTQTVISEWGLVCSQSWVKQVVTSLQMCGVLVGCVLSGQLGDRIGRKKVLYSFLLEHAIVNLIATFSTCWEMFAVCRFLIGIGLGGVLVVIFPYGIEFFPKKWRAILACCPFFALGVAGFSGAAYLFGHWSYLHLACAVMNFPYLLGWFYFPDSPRWLTVHGRLQDATAAFEKIASMNRRPLPSSTVRLLEAVSIEERRIRLSEKGYSYLDIFRGFKTATISLAFSYMWIALNMIYYGLSFGVASLDGNIYLNIFLMAMMEIPIQFTTLYTNNRFGRRPSAVFFHVTSALACVGCICTYLFLSGSTQGRVMSGMALTAKMLIGGAWCVVAIWGVELYPTVTRNLGYGLFNTASRVGGILAPFIVDLDHMVVASYGIMTGLLVICVILSLITRETKGLALDDSMVTATDVASDGYTLQITDGEKQSVTEIRQLTA